MDYWQLLTRIIYLYVKHLEETLCSHKNLCLSFPFYAAYSITPCLSSNFEPTNGREKLYNLINKVNLQTHCLLLPIS